MDLVRQWATGKGTVAIVARGAASAFTLRILGAILIYLLHVLLARWMGSYQYGLYVYALSGVAILGIAALPGLKTGLLRFVAQYNAEADYPRVKGVLLRTTQLTLLTSSALALTGAGMVFLLSDRLPEGSFFVFLFACGLLPLSMLSQQLQAALRALRHIWQAHLPELVVRPLLVIGLAYLARKAAGMLAASQTMYITLFAMVLVLVVGWLLLLKALPREVRDCKPIFDTPLWLSVSIPLSVISAMHVLLKQTDVFLVGFLLGPIQAGIYAAAVKTVTLVSFPLDAVNAIAAPMIASLHAQGKKEELQHMVTVATKWIFWTSLPLSLLLVSFGSVVLQVFGSEFVSARWALVILAGGQLINAACGSVGNLMMMTGHQNQSAKVFAWSALINITANILLIPLLGINGAAIATAGSTALWNLWLMILVYRQLNIRSTVIVDLVYGRPNP